MKEAYWGYWLVVLGIFIIVVLLLVQSFTSTNSQDYYMVKSITESSMQDSIDWAYYNTYGEIKINKEKFMEVFLRRFAEEASIVSTYTVTFSDIYEAPPKVSVEVKSKSGSFSIVGDSESFDIVNKIDGILESSTYNGVTSFSDYYPINSAAVYADYIDNTTSTPSVSGNCKFDFHNAFCTETVCNNPLKFTIQRCGTSTALGQSEVGLKEGIIYCYATAEGTADTYGFFATYDSFTYGNICAKEE